MKKDSPDPCFGLLPRTVHQALLDMPHSNQRSKAKPWQEFYTAETMGLVLEMYGRDFLQFGCGPAARPASVRVQACSTSTSHALHDPPPSPDRPCPAPRAAATTPRSPSGQTSAALPSRSASPAPPPRA